MTDRVLCALAVLRIDQQGDSQSDVVTNGSKAHALVKSLDPMPAPDQPDAPQLREIGRLLCECLGAKLPETVSSASLQAVVDAHSPPKRGEDRRSRALVLSLVVCTDALATAEDDLPESVRGLRASLDRYAALFEENEGLVTELIEALVNALLTLYGKSPALTAQARRGDGGDRRGTARTGLEDLISALIAPMAASVAGRATKHACSHAPWVKSRGLHAAMHRSHPAHDGSPRQARSSAPHPFWTHLPHVASVNPASSLDEASRRDPASLEWGCATL